MRRSLLIGLVGAWACKPVPAVPLELPPDVELYGVVALEQGRVVGATPLVRRSEPLPFVGDDTPTHLVIGLRGSALGGPELVELLVGEAPREASGCVPALPEVRALGQWIGGRLLPTDEVLPALTTPGWSTRCPDEAPELRINAPTLCLGQACSPRIVRRSTCSYEVDLESCGLGRPPLTVDPLGRICVGLDPARFQCRTLGDGVVCEDGPACPIHFEPRSPSAPAPFTQDLIAVGEPLVDPISNYVNSARFFQRGVVRDLAKVGPHLVVTRSPDGDWSVECETSRAPNVLWFFDAESLAPTATVAAGRCAHHLAVEGDHLYYASYDGGWRVTEADQDGHPLRTGPLPAGLYPPGPYDVVELLVLGPKVVVVFGASESNATDGGVVVLDRVDLRLRYDLHLPDRLRPSFAHAFGPDALVISAAEQQRVAWIDLVAGEVAQEVVVRTEFLPDATLMRGLVVGDHYFTAGHTDLYEVNPDAVVHRHVFHDEQQLLFSLERWPSEPARFMALSVGAVEAGGNRPGYVSFYLPEESHFLPGRWRVSDRPVASSEVEPNGTVWLLVPELAQVVRLRPR